MVLFVTVRSGRYAPALTPCSQSQIGRTRYLRRCEAAQVDALFGVVRGCPLGTGQDRCEWHASGTAGSTRAARNDTPGRSAMVQGWATSPDTLTGWLADARAGQVGDSQPSTRWLRCRAK
jgi:hypothetical protein